MEYFAFSDIHGHGELFDKILNWLNGRSEPWKCIFLGDACDRMQDGYRIIKTILRDERFIYLKGNHEDLFVRAAKALKQHWLQDNVTKAMAAENPYAYVIEYSWDEDVGLHIQNGGLSTLMDWASDGSPLGIIGELERLPEHMTLPHAVWGELDLSHAGHLKDNSDSLIWSREHFHEEWEGGRMIHGHTPVRSLRKRVPITNPQYTSRPAFYANSTKIDIDVACFLSNIIVLLNLDTFEQHAFFTDSFFENEGE